MDILTTLLGGLLVLSCLYWLLIIIGVALGILLFCLAIPIVFVLSLVARLAKR